MLTVVDGQNNEIPENYTEAASTEEVVAPTLMDEVMGALEGTNVGLEEIAALIALPDEQFNILSELVLDELQKSVNNPQDRLLIQQALIDNGETAASMITMSEELMQEIDEQLGSQLPQNKLDFLKRAMAIVTNMFIEAEGAAKSIISIPIEVMEHGILPTYAHDGDAAMDIYATEDITVDPGQTVLVKTGIKVAIPRGYALLIQPRSGQSFKTKLRVANTPGLIDSGYRDEIGVLIENIEAPLQGKIGDTKSGNLYGKSYIIEKGQRIAQMRLVEVPTINWLPVENILDFEGDRGGGFGSSGQ